jgi:hypothetical protein
VQHPLEDVRQLLTVDLLSRVSIGRLYKPFDILIIDFSPAIDLFEWVHQHFGDLAELQIAVPIEVIPLKDDVNDVLDLAFLSLVHSAAAYKLIIIKPNNPCWFIDLKRPMEHSFKKICKTICQLKPNLKKVQNVFFLSIPIM